MRACRLAMASALLGMAVTVPFAAMGTSFQVGITLVGRCDVRTANYTERGSGVAAHADCSTRTAYSIARDDRPMDGRSRPAVVPDGAHPVSIDQQFRITTITF